MTPKDYLFCHFNNYLLENHWLIYDMTGFDISQLCARCGICELELLSFPVRNRLTVPYLPNEVESRIQQRSDSSDNIHISFKGSYKHISVLQGGMDSHKCC